jgi:hypothetical protein
MFEKEVMMKNIKKLFDSFFRGNIPSWNIYSHLLRQFDLDQAYHGSNRRSKSGNMKSSLVILSLCLMTGLSIGVGSAFADNEWVPDTAPIDQPAHQEKVDVKAPSMKAQQNVESSFQEVVPKEGKVERGFELPSISEEGEGAGNPLQDSKIKEPKAEGNAAEEKSSIKEIVPTEGSFFQR